MSDETSPRLTYDSDGVPCFVFGGFTTRIVGDEDDALAAIADASELLGVDGAMDRLAFERKDAVGDSTFYRFCQRYEGVPVFGRDVVVVVGKSGVPTALSGAMFAGSGIGTTPKKAVEGLAAQPEVAAYLCSAELVILPTTNESGNLCWKVETPERIYLYSAETGELLESFFTMTYKSGEGEMRRGKAANYDLELDAWFEKQSGSYVSEDRDRNIYVYDAMGQKVSHGSGTPAGERNELDCPLMMDNDNVWERDDVAKALANVERAYDAYSGIHGRGYDGNNGRLNVFVRVGSDEENVTNACSNPAGWERVKSDGTKERVPAFIEFNTKNNISYACALHEYTHLVQRSICPMKLDVMGESILEAYADVMAITILEDRSWKYDDNCRNVADPLDKSTTEAKGESHAISYADTGDPNTSWGSDAHRNSTVISHTAYLMYESGMTFKELRTLWHFSMFLLHQDSDVFAVRAALVTSAFLLGYGDEKVAAIERAFDEVGIPAEIVEATSIPGKIDHFNSSEVSDLDLEATAKGFVRAWYDDWSFDGSGEVQNPRSLQERCLPLIDESSDLYPSFEGSAYPKSAYSGLGEVETCVLEEPTLTSASGDTYRVSVWYTSKQEPNVSPGTIDKGKYDFLSQSRRREASWDVTVTADGKVRALSLAPRGPYTLSGRVRTHEEAMHDGTVSVASLVLDEPVDYLFEYKWTEKAEANDVLLGSSRIDSYDRWAVYGGHRITVECDDLQRAYHDASFLKVDSLATGDIRLVSVDADDRDSQGAGSQPADKVTDDSPAIAEFDGKDYWVVLKEGFRGGGIEASSFSVSSGSPEVIWDKSLTVSGANVKGSVSQFCLNENGECEKIGEYQIPTDRAWRYLLQTYR